MFEAMRGSSNSGFTIIELVAVIIVIGILAAVAAPRFASQSGFDQRYFVDDIVSGARYARQFAVSKGCYTRISLTTTDFSLQRDDDCDGSAFNFTSDILRPDDSVSAYTLDGAPAGTVAGTVVFDPQGRAGDIVASEFVVFAAAQTLTVGTSTVDVYGETGFVR